jgi:hypothetical protein
MAARRQKTEHAPAPRSGTPRYDRPVAGGPGTRVLRSILLLILVVVGILTIVPHRGQAPSTSAPLQSARTPPTRPLQIGIAYGNTLIGMDEQDLGNALDDAVSVGAGTIRTDLAWGDVQPDGPDEFRWARFDGVVHAAQARGLRLLLVVAYTPHWARPAGCDSDKCAPADPARFADFARAAAERYASEDVLGWEIWNEQNTPGFWAPKVDPEAYTALLQATSTAIRGVDPSALILLGGLASVDTTDGGMAPGQFLSRVCALGGNTAVGAVAYHPYTYPYLASESRRDSTPWGRMNVGRNSLRSVLGRYGTPDLPIWLTEYGAPTSGPGAASDGDPKSISAETTHVTEERQAQIARDVLLTVAQDRHVGALIWYSDRDLGEDTGTNLNFYGLRRSDGTKKPAFSSFEVTVGHLDLGPR